LIPAGLDVTVPAPVPDLLTVNAKVCWASVKVAVAVLAAFIVTVHVAPDAVSQPFQLANAEPAAADAVRVTVVPLS
jgi:hypothetical protein